jgi:hypothetical protein
MWEYKTHYRLINNTLLQEELNECSTGGWEIYHFQIFENKETNQVTYLLIGRKNRE